MDTATKKNSGRWSATIALVVFGATVLTVGGHARAQTALVADQPHVVSGAWHTRQYFFIDVPRRAVRLLIQLSGGTGNAHIYAKRTPPAVGPWIYSSTHPGNHERIELADPQPGRWFIMVYAHSAYHNASLVAHCDLRRRADWTTVAAGMAPVMLQLAMAQRAQRDDADNDDDDDDNETRRPEEKPDAEKRVVASRIVTLKSGVWTNDLAGDDRCRVFYRIIVPRGQVRLTFMTKGGEGNCLLFVRRGALPTAELNDGSSALAGAAQAVAIDEPSSGVYYAWLVGKERFTGVSLMAEYGETAKSDDAAVAITPLANDQAAAGLAGAAGSTRYFMIHFARDQSRLIIKTRGGSGDCDIYVRRNALPTLKEFDHKRIGPGTEHTMEFKDNVAAGTYYVMVHGRADYRGVALTAAGVGR